MVKKALGEEVVSMFLTGPCGNINHIDIKGESSYPTDHYKKMGRILAGEALKVREKICVSDRHLLTSARASIAAAVRQPTIDEAQKAEQTLKAIPKKKTNYWDDLQAERYFAEQLLTVYRDPQKSVEIAIQVMRIGDIAIVAMPCELLWNLGWKLKEVLHPLIPSLIPSPMDPMAILLRKRLLHKVVMRRQSMGIPDWIRRQGTR